MTETNCIEAIVTMERVDYKTMCIKDEVNLCLSICNPSDIDTAIVDLWHIGSFNAVQQFALDGLQIKTVSSNLVEAVIRFGMFRQALDFARDELIARQGWQWGEVDEST